MEQPTVMVCEDDWLIRSDICNELREAGYRVIEAKNADFAQAIFLSGEQIDLLSTNVAMPGTMDGLDLAYWVRKKHPTVRIMVLTGWPKPEVPDHDFDSFVAKPFKVNEVVQQIKAFVPLGL